ncbi:TPA: HlyC/CorC family transporter [Candidatus Bipolaricaulota bacterium]|nr:HlyC/CorC family transporter [Candidatus Bipolaricaulota bacterium]
MSPGSQSILLIILLALSAFFSGSETAITSISEFRLKHLLEREKDRRRAKALQHLLSEPNDLITCLLVWNNLVNVGASALATLLFLRLLPAGLPAYVSGLVTTFVMTALLLLFGEITPKNLAKNRAEAVALKVLVPVWQLTRFTFPAVRALRALSHGMLRPFGEELLSREGTPLSEDQLITFIEEGEERGIIPVQDGEMMKRILTLDEITAEEVMVPRTEMQAIEAETPLEEVLRFVVEDGHSRYPVYEGNRDNVIGILYVKDLLRTVVNGSQKTPLRELLRPAYYTPTTKPVNVLLREFQRERVHMAVVVDEYGGVAGIVTLEDILEEIVGEIEDEYDRPRSRQLIRRISAAEAVVDGDAEVRLVNRTLGLELPEDEAVTIAGLILEKLGDIPDPGARLQIDRALLTVEGATEREITSVRVTLLPQEEPAQE